MGAAVDDGQHRTSGQPKQGTEGGSKGTSKKTVSTNSGANAANVRIRRTQTPLETAVPFGVVAFARTPKYSVRCRVCACWSHWSTGCVQRRFCRNFWGNAMNANVVPARCRYCCRSWIPTNGLSADRTYCSECSRSRQAVAAQALGLKPLAPSDAAGSYFLPRRLLPG